MTGAEIRRKFINFFIGKDHTLVPSSSLIPDDPSVLLTTAGMQQFKPYYYELDPTVTVHPLIGKPLGRNAVSIQKSFRTSDIDEVGDSDHLTFFEMLGNFSFGGYFKKEAIAYAHEFITKVMNLDISYVTVFAGSDFLPKDEESKKIWNELGIVDVREQGMEDVFWGPTGSSGPCGPTTEIYCRNTEGIDVEIWNIVFNEHFSSGSREELLGGQVKLKALPHPGVDTGMGLERLAMIVQDVPNVFETDIMQTPFKKILAHEDKRNARITVDHLRASVFLLSEGLLPSNKDRGYILRRIIRRLIVCASRLGIGWNELVETWIGTSISFYGKTYPVLAKNQDVIIGVFSEEAKKFARTYAKGLNEFKKKFSGTAVGEHLGPETFYLYQSFGLTPDVIKDLATEAGYVFDEQGFNAEFKKHQQISKAGVSGKFGGHGLTSLGQLKTADKKEVQQMTKLHTATHLLHQALRLVLGDEIHQQGSDITAERLRFDFSFSRKLTPQEIKQVETLVNDNIKNDLPVSVEEMPFSKAQEDGALAFFADKYPPMVRVYTIGAFSKEVCNGPHVERTGEIGKFKILKEEAISAGVRRIRAAVS